MARLASTSSVGPESPKETADAFRLVIPSMQGYGFSGKSTTAKEKSKREKDTNRNLIGGTIAMT